MNIIFKIFLFFLIQSISCISVFSQSDTAFIRSSATVKNPKLATSLSAIIPGAGQIYNQKYWKAPIVWGGMGALVYSILYNGAQFKLADNQLALLKDSTGKFKTDVTSRDKITFYSSEADYYRRYRDLSYIGISLFYIYQIIDASVDAHLSEFDLSEKIALRVAPNINLNGSGTVSFTFYRKNKNTFKTF